MGNLFTFLKDFMRYKPYDVEELKAKFTSMSITDIMKEYYYVDRMRAELLSGKYPEEMVFEYCEPLDEAWDFLGQFLAHQYCSIHGLPF